MRPRGQGFWEAIAARMVDAQAAPLARRLRRARGMLYQSSLPHAEQLLAHELASLYLLTQAWQRIDVLPPALQADVRTLLGWTVSQEEVLREPPVADRWRILSQTVSDDERLRVRTSWLRGAVSGRWALILQYAAGNQGFEQALVPGTEFDGALHFYPSAHPLRALVKQQAETRLLVDGPGQPSTMDTLLDDYAHALAVQPFLDRYPALLGGLVPDISGRAILHDAQGRGIDLHPAFRHSAYLLALRGGHPLTICGEWDGRTLLPLSAWHESRLYNVDTDPVAAQRVPASTRTRPSSTTAGPAGALASLSDALRGTAGCAAARRASGRAAVRMAATARAARRPPSCALPAQSARDGGAPARAASNGRAGAGRARTLAGAPAA